MKKFNFLVSMTILLFAFNLKAQEKWSVEFRPGLNFPTSDVGNTDAKVGFGFELTGAYKILPYLVAYVGWGLNEFKGEDNLLKEDVTLKETGYTFGFQMIHPIGTSSFSYLARAGAIYNHIEIENNSSTFNADTGHGFGWQVAAGVDYEFAANLALRPMLRYRSLSRDVTIENISSELKLNYISFGIGLVWEF
ncbi:MULTISPECIES: outer membrane beta-barrel protein [Aequorivita]|nr:MULTISPECIES: outer membrane beta-barrel protein [Aequorivita]UCA55218.1 porin family protein [Aequorivita sp. F7]